MIEGKEETKPENPTESQLEEELRVLISDGLSLSTVTIFCYEKLSLKHFISHIRFDYRHVFHLISNSVRR